jgi:hypothetical protein
MKTLEQLATSIGTAEYELPSGAVVEIPTLILRFPLAEPPRLDEGVLKPTYTVKPLVDVDGEPVFGELAIARWLAKDGWSALWVDTFHGRKFWRDMPHLSDPIEPPASVRESYKRIADLKGGPSGCFDVVAWKNDRTLWLEYKGPGDTENRNERGWIDAALHAGVCPEDLVFVSDTQRKRASVNAGARNRSPAASPSREDPVPQHLGMENVRNTASMNRKTIGTTIPGSPHIPKATC